MIFGETFMRKREKKFIEVNKTKQNHGGSTTLPHHPMKEKFLVIREPQFTNTYGFTDFRNYLFL